MEKLRELFIKSDKFLIGTELVTTRGIIQEEKGKKLLGLAEELAKEPDVDWISFTDNAGGNPMLSPDFLGRKVVNNGKNVIINITCKDRNRNALESDLWKYSSEGFENLLVLTGDYPVDGYRGPGQPTFDIDSVGLLVMINNMNRGLQVEGKRPGVELQLEKTGFFTGCTVSPFKFSEAELVMQYEKLLFKLRSGAEFIIPQIGYDIRKSDELLSFLEESKFNIPVFGNIYRLSAGIARLFNKNKIPGCIVSDSLLKRFDKEIKSHDKGKSYFTDFAAKQLVAFKGIGYKGVYIGGFDKYEDFNTIIERAGKYKPEEWKDFIPELTNPKEKEFYYFSLDKNTQLADRKNHNEILAKHKKFSYLKYTSPFYLFCLFLHALVFDYKAPLFGLSRFKFRLYEKKQLKLLNRFAMFNERMFKSLLFVCRDCGDCSLPDITYLCPVSQCSKDLRNGPCGGSFENKCERTSTGKDCIWTRAYYRNKYSNGDKIQLLDRKPVLKNNKLKGTSGWANCFLLRDHNAYLGEKYNRLKK